jgi:Na+/proline symporter
VYPQFIWNNLPPGIAGLVIAAILAAAMSNLSAALNALASTTIMDFYKPLTTSVAGVSRSEAHYLKLARWATVAWGVVLFLIGLVARNWDQCSRRDCPLHRSCTEHCSEYFSSGCSRSERRRWAPWSGMLASLLVMFYVKRYTGIAWTWYVLIGSTTTIACRISHLICISSQVFN